MSHLKLIAPLLLIFLTSCNSCDENQAYNKMLALGKFQGRIAAMPGDGGVLVASAIGTETGVISELIAQKKYDDACKKADELAKKYDVDLDKEQKGMITIEQLKVDGGKGSGTCSIADAAKKQMELHGMLQKEVDAGKRSADIFRQFNEDTKGYGEMLSTNPSAACKLFDDLKVKYKVK